MMPQDYPTLRRIDMERVVKSQDEDVLAVDYDFLECYEDCVQAIAEWLNQWMRFSVELPLNIDELIALAWHYARQEKADGEHAKDLDNYETFIEALRTDVYMRLYRRVSGHYGFREPCAERR